MERLALVPAVPRSCDIHGRNEERHSQENVRHDGILG